jgi:large subunit ribosomal protein L22
MSYLATHRFARIAPRKARLVADLIRGQSIDSAMTELQLSKKRAAWYFKAVLRSAIANAEEADADVSALVVTESRVDEGPTIKRFRPKDRGRAHPIRKRTSHLHIIVDEKNKS